MLLPAGHIKFIPKVLPPLRGKRSGEAAGKAGTLPQAPATATAKLPSDAAPCGIATNC